MAKGARASTKKANNAKLKSKVYGPVETARTERLSAKLLELASQPKPEHSKDDTIMELEGGNKADTIVAILAEKPEDGAMDLDAEPMPTTSKPRRGRVEKRRSSRKAAIVFPKYKDGKRIAKSKAKK